MIEAQVETYLARRVKELGGEVRKVSWVSKRGAPDRLVLLPGYYAFIELKRPGKKPTLAQLREHDKLRSAGLTVLWFDSKQEIDAWASGRAWALYLANNEDEEEGYP